MTVRAPQHLSRPSKALYRRLAADYALDAEPHALEVLRLGLEALDRADEARQALAQHGVTFTDRFGSPRARPEVTIERDSRLAAVRCFRELALDGDVGDARMPRTNGARS